MKDARRDGVDRRRLLSMGGTAIAASSLAAPAAAAARARGRKAAQMVAVSEGTNIAVSVAPDGRTLAFDLYGVIWTLPVAGGRARRITDDLTDGAQPDWSPDGKTLVFQSYRDGTFQIWTVNADGTGLRQHTRGAFDCREPRFSPDGKSIAFSSDRTGSYAIHVLDLATGATRLWAAAEGQACEPAWSPDGARIAFAVERAAIEIVDATGGRTKGPSIPASAGRLAPAELHSPAFTPDGKGIVYAVVEKGRAELRGPNGALVTGEASTRFRKPSPQAGRGPRQSCPVARRQAGGLSGSERPLAAADRRQGHAARHGRLLVLRSGLVAGRQDAGLFHRPWRQARHLAAEHGHRLRAEADRP